jgi:hypothetical protein
MEQDATVLLQEPHCATSQMTAFFIVTAMKTSNLAIKEVVFWDMTPCDYIKRNLRFGGTLPSSVKKTICTSETRSS